MFSEACSGALLLGERNFELLIADDPGFAKQVAESLHLQDVGVHCGRHQ